LKALGARGGEGKGGVVGSVPHGGRRRSREGPDTVVGSAERSARAPGRRAWAVALWHDRGGRRGVVDTARAADKRDRAASSPVGSGWVRKEEEEARQQWRRALTGRAGSTMPLVRF
jgi:hypothetical protein